LLVCSKALAFCDESELDEAVFLTLNFASRKFEDECQSQNLLNIVEKMRSNPETAKSVYCLYPGNYLKTKNLLR
jgi:hypothetical protein